MTDYILQNAIKHYDYYTNIFGRQANAIFKEIISKLNDIPQSGTFGKIVLHLNVHNTEIDVSKIKLSIFRLSDVFTKVGPYHPDPYREIVIETTVEDYHDRYSMRSTLTIELPEQLIKFLSSKDAMIRLIYNIITATSRFSDYEDSDPFAYDR